MRQTDSETRVGSIPTIWLAFALSLILHAAALWVWLPKVLVLPFEDAKKGKQSGSLAVRLAPPPVPSVQTQRVPPQRPSPPKAEPQRRTAPRVLALERPPPSIAPPPPAETASPPAQAVRPPVHDDLASYIEARRRSREAVSAPPPSQGSPSAPLPAETEKERHNRIVAANLGLSRAPSFGAEREPGGGVFQIHRMGYNDAEFLFFGWNKFINRNSQQMIEVRRGDSATIELAVVRRMIAIIREHESGDFVWKSQRLGRDLKLSARLSDNAGLEEVLMREFFSELRSR